MNKILTSGIAAGKGMPFSKRSLDHLQAAISQLGQAFFLALVDEQPGLIMLSGGEVSQNGTVHSNGEGFAYWNGEVYEVLEGIVDVPAGQVAAWVIDETFLQGDPVQFTDLTYSNIHAVRKIKLAAMPSGTTPAYNGYTRIETLLHNRLPGKANVAQPAWQNLALQNTCTNGEDAITYAPAYMKDTLGFVHLRGEIMDSVQGATIAATLPAGFRPSKRLYFRYSTGGITVSITVHPNGEIHVGYDTVANDNTYAYILENCPPFQAEA